MPDNDIIEIDSAASQKRVDEAKRIPIFSIDGQVYDVAGVERADIGLEYIGRVIEDGEDAASAYLIVETMGEDAFQALRNVVGLEPEKWRGVMDKIQKVVTPKARGNRASRRA